MCARSSAALLALALAAAHFLGGSVGKTRDPVLTDKQAAFVDNYLITANAKIAAIAAGYSKDTARQQGNQLLYKTSVLAEIKRRQAERAERLNLEADDVLREIAKTAFSDIRKVATFGEDGVRIFDSEDIHGDAAAAIQEVSERRTSRRVGARVAADGDESVTTIITSTIKVKLHDKLKALDMAGRHLGLWGTAADPGGTPPPVTTTPTAATFEQFCERAGYPRPFPKQQEMRAFVFDDESDTSRMLLGSRGYGKTDYVTILGTAYEIYQNIGTGQHGGARVLILTKSDDRNKAIIAEIAKALKANGVTLDAATTHHLRAAGLRGKDHSAEALTVGSNAVRGHHPDIIILDDPVTEEDVSEATRKRLERKYNELVKLTPNIVLIGQPVHVFDQYETLRPIVKVMEVPHGTIPELDHDLVAMKLAGVSETSINASYHLKVSSETGNPLSGVSWLDSFPAGDSVAFIDPSFKGGDYTAMSVGRGHFDGVAIQGFAWKKAWFDLEEETVAACKAHNIRRLCFETNSLGTQPLAVLREWFKKAGIQVGVTGRDSSGFKHSRIMATGAFAKQIHLSKTSHRTYIDQTTKYEYGSKFDDAPDSLASLLSWIGLIKGKA